VYDEMTVIYGGRCESMALAAIVPYCDDPQTNMGRQQSEMGINWDLGKCILHTLVHKPREEVIVVREGSARHGGLVGDMCPDLLYEP
jgi:hypothetical protein